MPATSPGPAAILAIATLDTKGAEIAYLAERMRAHGCAVRILDVSTGGPASQAAEVTAAEIASHHPEPAGAAAALGRSDRGVAVAAMGVALTAYLTKELRAGRVAGAIGLGGTGGTALIAPALRTLPLGLPKILVSTVASGDTRPYVGTSDLLLMPSVVDICGLNRVLVRVLDAAARAMAGMALLPQSEQAAGAASVALTMFGVTTPCVTAVRTALEAQGQECLVFHANGTGGRTMEHLVASGLISAVLDLTTTEVADELVGGVFSAGPGRFDAIIEARIPWVLSLGALDMVNFGARDTVPERFRSRRLHTHNAQVTLMRTSVEECRSIARFIADKLRRATSPHVLIIPEGGFSALSATGQPFHDPAADRALIDTLLLALPDSPLRSIVRLPHHINEPEVAAAAVAAFRSLTPARTAMRSA